MVILEVIGVGIFWVVWWFGSAFIAEQAADDKGAEKREVSSRVAAILVTIPVVVLPGYRLVG
ncbi:hypothetical protein COU19_02610 [Candidatus Kaiserbacteria bacterium CG10_big_fil_rev_8_21_14_0_10_56_12]|uniref:Uncharacterized protein n=1 Tax=Candidatus Kaiserbacteria bacterium CG10_big_fil_rev_8_21_14_0_10_56_12 TaxID=1974611 RepID=A0A2H0U9G3_9BACT|nr:MAG: hypothetical protein COU19_02610 [Candidatus Kaiserbacteria bacterium CG10_big_fil_rev_8_21_14_0_10_56_12]